MHDKILGTCIVRMYVHPSHMLLWRPLATRLFRTTCAASSNQMVQFLLRPPGRARPLASSDSVELRSGRQLPMKMDDLDRPTGCRRAKSAEGRWIGQRPRPVPEKQTGEDFSRLAAYLSVRLFAGRSLPSPHSPIALVFAGCCMMGCFERGWAGRGGGEGTDLRQAQPN